MLNFYLYHIASGCRLNLDMCIYFGKNNINIMHDLSSCLKINSPYIWLSDLESLLYSTHAVRVIYGYFKQSYTWHIITATYMYTFYKLN